MLKSNKNNARNNLSQCVEFRSKKETAISGNVDGEKTWNNLDQNVLRKIFLADALLVRVQILETNRKANRTRVESS